MLSAFYGALVHNENALRRLLRHSGRITSAAAEFGISRPTLYELMEKPGTVRE